MRAVAGALLLALTLSACEGATEVAQAPSPSEAKPFPALEAESVLSLGFQAIMEFSLSEIDTASFALEGAKGLGAIDPNLVARLDGQRFQLRLGEEIVFTDALPKSRDPRGWARLVIEGLLAARAKSAPLGEAQPETVYQAVFDAALARFDLYSRYATAQETRRLRARRDGQGEDGAKLPPTVGLSVNEHTAFLRIVGFNRETASDLEARLKEVQASLGRQWTGLVIDLRGNPGGLLEQAVKSADLFLGAGRIVSARGRHPMASVNHEAGEGDLAPGIPIVVLVDGNSASGAEILAAALQDRGRAVVVGTVTYGKGLVQTVVELPNGGELDISWSGLHAPSGYALQGLGVLPNVCLGAGAKRGNEAVATDFAQWRMVGTGNQAARQKLRTVCPPTVLGDEASIQALRLLSDRSLYAKALAPTGTSLALRP